MREFFRFHRFSPDARNLVQKCSSIATSFHANGRILTLRQLYYQLVKDNLIKNEDRQYKRLSSLLSDARLMGMIDWEAIEDRIRVPRVPPEFNDLDELMAAALSTYRLPRWEGQESYVELWVEKDALAGILRPLAHEYHVTMSVNRGYSSQSAMYDAAKRYLLACYGKDLPYTTLAKLVKPENATSALEKIQVLDRDELPKEPRRKPILLYLGDHDPSGEDMLRDIEARLGLFGIDVDVRKLALTREQVEQYDPPPNPAKMSDPRASEYVDKHGAVSWEVDALSPEVLDQIIRDAIEEVLDLDKMNRIKRREERDKKLFSKAVASLRKKT